MLLILKAALMKFLNIMDLNNTECVRREQS